MAFFWEIIIIYRKILLIAVAVFLSTTSAEVQVLVSMLIIVVSIVAHLRINPYYTDVLNRMEALSLVVCVVTMYSGMFFVTGRYYTYMLNNGVRWFFFICVLLPNILFLLYWAH
jgi:hypothetical protein